MTMVSFAHTLKSHKVQLRRESLTTLQVNVGKLCNQACLHCHVEAGPKRTEIMTKETVDRILSLLKNEPQIKTVDLTGGAPEMNPHFQYFASEIRAMDKEVINRCNLTVLFEKGQEETAAFFKAHQIHVIASLPCYSKDNVEKQRGRGVFDKSIRALRLLNDLGYGKAGSGLELDLVYNPLGAFLPPAQAKLENDYRQELRELFGIEFNRLFTITNMPIKRFLVDLNRQGKLETYMELLLANFNREAALGVMCKSLVSIGWDGEMFDCDFNQMLSMPVGDRKRTIWDVDSLSDLLAEEIALGNHCYACTAGAGSSCTGTLS